MAPDAPQDALRQLEHDLSGLSHSEEDVQLVQAFVAGLGKTKAKQQFFLPEGVLVQQPVQYEEALEAGRALPEEDPFTVLQGDLIQTEAAYFMGKQVGGLPRFIVANSTCDLVEGRRTYAALLRVRALHSTETNWANKLGALLTFESTRTMFLPPLPGDESTVVANVIDFDGFAQITLGDLHFAVRTASLTLVGWRIFSSMLRGVLVRTGDSEIRLRATI